MTDLGTTILADKQLQDVVNPFDLFHKPETDPHHIDSNWITASPKLHLPDDNGPIYIEKRILMGIMMIQALGVYKLNLNFKDFIKRDQI